MKRKNLSKSPEKSEENQQMIAFPHRIIFKSIFAILAGALLIYTVVFFAVSIMPVDPARAIAGPYAPESTIAAVREQFGLDRPLPVQYIL